MPVKLINITNEGDFPKEIEKIVWAYLSALPEKIADTIRKTSIEHSIDVVCAVDQKLLCFEELTNKVKDILFNTNLVCYHATKVLNLKDITEQGLLRSAWSWYSFMLINNMKALNISEADITKALSIVKIEQARKIGKVCFYVRDEQFIPKHGAGYYQFCENIGGEIVRWSSLSQEMPEVYKKLKSNGQAIIVKVALPYEDIACEVQARMAEQFIYYYIAKYFWDFEYEIDFDCYTFKDIPVNNILEIISVMRID